MERVALDGPFKGKRYTLPNGVQRVIDHWYDDFIYLHKVTYLVTDDGLIEETREIIKVLDDEVVRHPSGPRFPWGR
jgi:hypothetical protein